MKMLDGIPISKLRQYRIWQGMKQRCYNQRNIHYDCYGGKGIRICDEWLGADGFLNFYHWSLSHGYENEMTIDRVDSSENYSPQNCVWVPQSWNGGHAPLWQQLFCVIANTPTYEWEYIEAHMKKINDPAILMSLEKIAKSHRSSHASLSNHAAV